MPAALCGTYGLKVTHGRIPLVGVFPLVGSIDTVGPLADSMENIDLAYRAMSRDTRLLPEKEVLRLGIPQPWYENSPTDEEIADDFAGAVEMLRAIGHEVHPINMPDVEPSLQLWNAIAGEVRDVHAEFRKRNEPYGDDVALRLSEADLVTEEEGADAAAWQRQMRARFSDALTTVDFLITPTVPVRRKVIGEEFFGNRHYRAVLSYFSALVNHTLNPALALPLAGTGRSDEGRPPTSIQVIGAKDAETSLIAFGRSLETAGISGFEPAPISSPRP